MGGEVTLKDALEQIDANNVKERAEGLANLKHVLRHNQNSTSINELGDISFHRIYEALFRVAIVERSTWLNAKTSVTKTAAENRLSVCASALRQAVEIGAQIAKLKTVKALLDHIIQTLPLPGGGLCAPLALEYAKSMRHLLSDQSHVEHLQQNEWERAALFCVATIKSAGVDATDDDAGGTETISNKGTFSDLSYRSSRSMARDSVGSQSFRSSAKQVAEEIVAGLSLLTAAPNAPLRRQASKLLWALIEFLKSSSVAGRSHQDAFAAINHVLAWTRTEDITLTQKVANHLVRLIRHFWHQKSSALKDEMLVTALYLSPYLMHSIRQDEGVSLRAELSSLMEVMRAEYSRRLDREQFHLDDLRLSAQSRRRQNTGRIATAIFGLRCTSVRTEQAWTVINILAFLCKILSCGDCDYNSSGDEREDDVNLKPRKRQRMTDEFEENLSATTSGTATTRVCFLQIIAFTAQQQTLSAKQLSRAVDKLSASCSEENSTISSWALLALASCASQSLSPSKVLTLRWSAVWQLATRAMSNASTCRAACYVLSVMIHAHLVNQGSIAELMQILTSSIDLSGPAILADSVTCLLVAIVKSSQRSNSGTTTQMTDSILGWLFRTFLPSKFEDKTYATANNLYDVRDVAELISICLNHEIPALSAGPFPIWSQVGQTWLNCEQQNGLISYLLLLPREDQAIDKGSLCDETALSTTTVPQARISAETVVLTHFTSELQRAQESWIHLQHDRARSISLDMFKSIVTASCIVVCTVYDHAFRDTRRHCALKQQAESLLRSICDFIPSRDCDQDKVDGMLTIFSQALTGLDESGANPRTPTSDCETLLCCAIYDATESRRQMRDLSNHEEDDGMDLENNPDSQDSRRGGMKTGVNELKSDDTVAYTTLTLRSSVTLYATIIALLNDRQRAVMGDSRPASAKLIAYLLTLPDSSILSSRNVISRLPQLGILFTNEDTERLLQFYTDSFLESYIYERSEVALGAILDLMSSLTPMWTNSDIRSLFNLGLDMYNWFTNTALSAGVLSPNVQKKVASLLLQLCHVNTAYGTEDDVPSVRTSLFKLLEHGVVTVQFHVADRISTIFGLFVLSTHGAMFDDLQSSLPADADWNEGMAMRLLFLAKLASAWHSLLRQCVYYIFEAAGRVKTSTDHAAHCIAELTASLKFSSPQKLFRLFAPQLLHTWLETGNLTSLPYAAFQYTSLDELLEQNQAEITAQLLMRGSEDELLAISTALKTSSRDLATRAFAKSLAYTMSWDVATAKDAAPAETRLRNLVGGKEQYKTLVAEQFPAVMGHFFLSIQQDDVEDTWLDKCLEKKPTFTGAAKALKEIRSYSYSTRILPTSQQPSFKSKFLCDKIERLCRRIVLDPVKPWNSSSFTLSVRMLLDTIDDALGPLHMCLMLRKLRILICMAGEMALSGFALEMLLHSVRPFLNDSECADDALGILQYLLHHGQSYLRVQNVMFTTGTGMLMILQMCQHSASRQESTTQESQHKLTIKNMQRFRSWLVRYLKECHIPPKSKGHAIHAALTEALESVQLPGNARKDSSESKLVVQLLDQQRTTAPFLQRSDCMEALSLLSKNFEAPAVRTEDCLGEDDAAAKYANSLWKVVLMSSLDVGFLLWGAGVIGRAYAATGLRPQRHQKEDFLPVRQKSVAPMSGISKSQAAIASRLSDLLTSRKRAEAGLADFTLRKAHALIQGDEAIEFEQMLPDALVSAIAGGTRGYEPVNVVQPVQGNIGREKIRQALKVSSSTPDEEWNKTLAVTVCRWASDVSILPALPTILQNVSGLAESLLPAIIHMVLFKEVEKDPVLRSELSISITAHLAENEPALLTRQMFFIELILYLRTQPQPGEAMHTDRLKWIDIDFQLAADAAARCNLPTTALLFAESASTPVKRNRHVSSRASMSQVEAVNIPDELLLSIFKQIEEQDSFYGVQQPASLSNVLDRLDYEGDGLKSLMFRSAQMDSAMSALHRPVVPNSGGLIRSLSTLNLNSLTYSMLLATAGNGSDCVDEMFNAAKKLQQWDLTPPETASAEVGTCFKIFQELSRASDRMHMKDRLRSMLVGHVQLHTCIKMPDRPSIAWCNTLASLNEVGEALDLSSESALQLSWQNMVRRQNWMELAPFEEAHSIISNRQTLFSVFAQNKSLLESARIGVRYCKIVEVEALLRLSQFARAHGVLQDALSAATLVSSVATACEDLGINVDAAAKFETASVLWDTGEATASVQMLRDILGASDIEGQDIAVGRSGLLAQLGHQLAEARLQKPDEILSTCLEPAIKHLGGRNEGHEAGNVFYEFASFCDQQLQNPGNIEDFNRMARLRQKRLEDVDALEHMGRSSKKTAHGKGDIERQKRQTRLWLELDDSEYQRLKNSRDKFIEQSLQNYMLALHASDAHDICVLRFFALWLENADASAANNVVSKYLSSVPSWKFIVLLNQLMSRLEDDKTTFQASLKGLAQRICKEHPYHSLHHLYCSSRRPSAREGAAFSRFKAAHNIKNTLAADAQMGELLKRISNADYNYHMLAHAEHSSGRQNIKVQLKDFPEVLKVTEAVKSLKVPPATIDVPIRPDGDYRGVPKITKFHDVVSIMGGLSKPKALIAIADNGEQYRQLFKSSKEDLRQDAIMEQVFEEVSKMLRNHKATRQRNLQVRTYKVIPLTTTSGIMEFVPNSIAIGEYLEWAHPRYHPLDWKSHKARDIIAAVKNSSVEVRVKEYRRVCEHMHPVMRHFFFERFDKPDEWFEKRTAYTRTTAAISILGHVLGLGDRHCQNIMLDEESGEVVHIDLGVAFEAGRILPIPELVPFRLTRDIVDGMGVTKTEGVFRRCCEFTMDALRADKDSIMTLLNVLRYDPLYQWTVSPLRAKRMQDAQETGRNDAGGDIEEASSKKKEHEAGEADRSLAIVEKKLSKTLSTAATVNELIQQATDERNLGTLFQGWSAYF